jgi:hypothetical protein
MKKGETDMKKKITILTITAILLLVTALPALAANGQPPVNGCQPGADNQIVSKWRMFGLEDFAQFLVDEFDRDYDSALERATTIYNFCDHNKDGYACVMEQNLPNDANGSSRWLLIEDNHPFGGN